TINGVIHTAALTGEHIVKTIAETERSDYEKQFQPKVWGYLVLREIFKKKNLDFCIVTSSLSAILGGLGFAVYSAANSSLDAYVQYDSPTQSGRWISINLDSWIFAEKEEQKSPGAPQREPGITPAEGRTLLKRVLYHCNTNQVIVSVTALQDRIHRWVMLKTLQEEEKPGQEEKPTYHERPELSSTYTEPRDKLEQEMVAIWQTSFGIETIGIHDDYFEMGGDSLKGMMFVNKYNKLLKETINLKIMFEAPTIAQQVEYLRKNHTAAAAAVLAGQHPAEKTPEKRHTTTEKKYYGIEPTEKKEYYNQSSAQKRLYILQQMDRESTAYNMPYTIPLTEDTDPKKLEEIFGKLIRRHESFRTTFHMINPVTPGGVTPVTPGGVSPVTPGGEIPVQVIHDNRDINFAVSEEKRAEEFFRPFDLTQAPLIRVGIIKTRETETPAGTHPAHLAPPTPNTPNTPNTLQQGGQYLLLDMHHIITDGVSQEILIEEFNRLKKNEELPPLKYRYRDYAEWQNSSIQKQLMKQQQEFWQNTLSGELPVLTLPTDYPRPLIQSFEGSIISIALTKEETGKLKKITKENETTLYMTNLSIYTIVLSKLSGQEDIIVGTPTAGRRHADLEKIIGMFVNTLPMRNYPEG
ncbi:MAG: KR domain-containing protein, partial [bacterium]|nr:KR domain-containing protein [bacterium]